MDSEKALGMVGMQHHVAMAMIRDRLDSVVKKASGGYNNNSDKVDREVIEAYAIASAAVNTGMTAVPEILGDKGIVKPAGSVIEPGPVS